MDQVKFVKKAFKEFMVCLGRPYHFKFFKSFLPQILLCPFVNTFIHVLTYMTNCQIYMTYFSTEQAGCSK